jgi:hypothetical protein
MRSPFITVSIEAGNAHSKRIPALIRIATAERAIMRSPPTLTPEFPRDPARESHKPIEPEEKNRNNWTKVLIDTFV